MVLAIVTEAFVAKQRPSDIAKFIREKCEETSEGYAFCTVSFLPHIELIFKIAFQEILERLCWEKLWIRCHTHGKTLFISRIPRRECIGMEIWLINMKVQSVRGCSVLVRFN